MKSTYRVIIAGSRTIHDPVWVALAMARSRWSPTEVLSGGARGVDRLGESWARARNLPVRLFLASWQRYGALAGPERNGRMARAADALCLVWDGLSSGSGDMRRRALEMSLDLHELVVPPGRIRSSKACAAEEALRARETPVHGLVDTVEACLCEGCRR